MKKDERFQKLLDVLSFEMSSDLRSFNIQSIAVIVHGLAKMRVHNDVILKAVEDESERVVMNGNPQSNANTAWAFATLSNPAPNLFKKIEENSSKLFEEGNIQESANTAWAFAKLSIPAPNLFRKIEENSSKLVEEGNSQAIANTVSNLSNIIE